MRRQFVLIALLLMALGGLGWWLLSREAATPAPQDDNAPPEAPVVAQPPKRADVDQPQVAKPEPVPAAPAPVDEFPAEPADGSWLLFGRIEFVPAWGSRLLEALPNDQRELLIGALDFSNPKSRWTPFLAVVDGHGRFSCEFDPVHRGFEMNPAASGWEVALKSLAGQTVLKNAAETEPRPARDKVAGLATAVITGRRVNLGVHRIDLDAITPKPWILKGRVLHETGAVPTVTSEMWCQVQPENALWEWSPGTGLYPGANGRFTSLLFDAPENAPARPWRTTLPYDLWDDDLTEAEGEEFGYIKLPQPRVEGRVLDFGDIKVPGVLVEVRAAIEGHPPFTYAYDPLTIHPSDRKDPWVEMFFEGYHATSDVMVPLHAEPSRFVIAEARYTYTAKLHHPGVAARPVVATLAARPGEKHEIALLFKPVPSIPLRVENQAGMPVAVPVGWRVIRDGKEEWSQEAESPCRVPLEPGTTVEAFTWDAQRYPATARAGDTEIVLRVNQDGTGRSDVPRLDVRLPPSPAPGVTLNLHLLVQTGERKPVVHKVELMPGGTSLAEDISNDAGTARLWLEGGELFGYRRGPLTPEVTVQVAESGTTVAELPELALPPGGVLWGGVKTHVRCGEMPVDLTTHFRDANYHWLAEYENDGQISPWPIYAERIGEERTTVTIAPAAPHALLDGKQDIPTPLEPPADHGGLAALRIEVEPRVAVRVTRNGTPLKHFEVRLVPRNQRFPNPTTQREGCVCETSTGVAHLWAPHGPAELVLIVEGDDIALLPEQSVVEVGAGLLQVELSVGAVRIEFARPQDASDDDECDWLMYPMQGDRARIDEFFGVNWGEARHVQPGRYFFRPDMPLDQAAAFELDITEDRVITLPVVKAPKTTAIMLRLRQEDWQTFEDCTFEYFTASERGAEYAFTETVGEASVKVMPDGLEVRKLPLGKRVALRGVVAWRVHDEFEVRLLRPLVFVVKEGLELAAEWTRPAAGAVEAPDSWRVAVVSDLPGHMLPLYVSEQHGWARPGRHEFAVFDNDYREVLRLWIEVPLVDEEFVFANVIIEKLRERNLIPAEKPD